MDSIQSHCIGEHLTETTPREPVDWRYLAGLFDGEGTCCIRKGHQRPKTRPWSLSQYRLYVGFIMCDFEAIEYLHRVVGGRYSFVPSKDPRWRGAYHWQIETEGACNFLRGIAPFVKLTRKRQVIALAFKFKEVQRQGLRSNDQWRFEKMVDLWKQISEINKRGPRDSVTTERATPEVIQDEVTV